MANWLARAANAIPATREIPDTVTRSATPAEVEELRALIARALADAPHEHAEALAVALADPDSALLCYRVLAADRAIELSDEGLV